MRLARRAIPVRQRRQVPPEGARLAVGRTVTALRRTREALVEIDGQLGDLLVCIRTPGAAIDRSVPDRLARAKAEAESAFACLNDGLFA